MGFFSKKEVVPELPPAPKLPELPNPYESKKELPPLPVFPTVENGEDKFNPSTKIEVEGGIPSLPKNFNLSDSKSEEGSVKFLPKKSMEIMDFPKRRVLELNAEIENKPITSSLEPIYVRIDRFQSSKKNFEKIKEKVTEVEKVLRKIKDVKEKEEKELDEWSIEIEKLKSRLSEIDSDIFNQL